MSALGISRGPWLTITSHVTSLHASSILPSPVAVWSRSIEIHLKDLTMKILA